MPAQTGWYQLVEAIAEHLPELRPVQQRGLAAWVAGTIQGKSRCESCCKIEVDRRACFAALLRWMVSLWQGERLTLAIDATLDQDQLTAR